MINYPTFKVTPPLVLHDEKKGKGGRAKKLILQRTNLCAPLNRKRTLQKVLYRIVMQIYLRIIPTAIMKLWILSRNRGSIEQRFSFTTVVLKN